MTQNVDRRKTEAWRGLFRDGEQRREVVVIRKRGEPLLILAGKARFCIQALALYPAQTFFARRARDFLRFGLWLRLLPLFFREALAFDPKEPLGEMISRDGKAHDFAIFCGNPNTPGQRFMILTGAGKDRVVIKAGVSERARQLVLQEARFLREIQNLPYTSRLIGEFQTERLAALITPFVEGEVPPLEAMEEVARILESWILPRQLALGELPAWKRLVAANPPGMESWRCLQDRLVFAPLAHGDFAPWNIKATPQGWVILDWERGETPGVPGWDWFHFLIQPQVLVLRRSPEQIMRQLQEQLASPVFRDYAEKTGMAGMEWALLLAYLDDCLFVTRPGEGGELLRRLRQTLLEQQRLTLCGMSEQDRR